MESFALTLRIMPTHRAAPGHPKLRPKVRLIRRLRTLAATALSTIGLAAVPATANAQYAPYSPWYEGWLAGGRINAIGDAAADGNLTGQQSRYAFGVGGAMRLAEYTLLDFELPFYGQKFDVPPTLASTDDLVSVKTRGIAFALRQVAPLGPLDVFMGLGAGWYESALTARRSADEDEEFVDTGPGYQVSAGINLVLDRQFAVGLEARRLWLDADFGPATQGLADIGGRQVLLTLRFRDAGRRSAW